MREWNFAKIRQGAIQQMRTIFESLRHQQHKLYTAFLVCIWDDRLGFPLLYLRVAISGRYCGSTGRADVSGKGIKG